MSGRAPAPLQASKKYTVEFKTNVAGAKLYAMGPKHASTVLESDLGELIDYYFVGGKKESMSPDFAVAGYRNITGAAPLYAKSAYGFWQCKEHYKTQQEVTDAANFFRQRSIPLDNIVQDWRYWGNLGWGPHWDPAVYPKPAEMVQNLTNINVQLMVSVWSKFDTNTEFYKDMGKKGFMINGTNCELESV